MSDDVLSSRPDILLMLQDGLPDDIEGYARDQLTALTPKLVIRRQSGGPYAGLDLFLPTAVALFVAAGFFNGLLQEAGKDTYIAFKSAAIALWQRAGSFQAKAIGSAGKISQNHRYSLAFSITGEVVSGTRFKFILKIDVPRNEAEAGVECFLQLINDLLNDRLVEAEIEALLSYKPVGGVVLVTFDVDSRKIVPVNAFAR